MRKFQDYKRPVIETFKIYSKNGLIKKLKSDGNYNLEYALNLDIEDVIERLDASYLYSLSETRYEAWMVKIKKLIDSVCKELGYDRAGIRNAKARNLSLVSWSNIPEEEQCAVSTMVREWQKQNLSLETLDNFSYANLTYEISASEYISISVRASVWTYYISGKIEVDGQIWEFENLSYDSESNRL